MRERAEDNDEVGRVVLLERLKELPPELASRGRPFNELDRDYAFLDENYDQFEQDFPGEWVAVLDAKVLGHSRKFNHLWRELRKRGLAVRSPITVYIENPDLT